VKFSAGWGIRRVPSYNRDLKQYRSDDTFQALMATLEDRQLLGRLCLWEDYGDTLAWSAHALLRVLGGNVLHNNFIGHVVLLIKEPADGIFEPGRIFRLGWLCFEKMMVLGDRTQDRSGCYHDQDQDKTRGFLKINFGPSIQIGLEVSHRRCQTSSCSE
jgi:hypothetical protein